MIQLRSLLKINTMPLKRISLERTRKAETNKIMVAPAELCIKLRLFSYLLDAASHERRCSSVKCHPSPCYI